MSLSVVMAVYNEAATVESTINDVLSAPTLGHSLELVIVESNSNDGSRDIVRKFAGRPEVKLVWQDAPRGKGNAVRAGLAVATGDIVLINDADREYEVSDYPKLLAPFGDPAVNFVLGSRHQPGQAMRRPDDQRLRFTVVNAAHWVFTFLFNVVYGCRLKDPFTMYKVFRRSRIDGLHLEANRFDFDWELVAKLIRSGNRPLEIPITYESRSFESGKKIRWIHDPLTWLVALVKYRFARLY
jgi:glycosyltransferase involved in cell wall biosynthesis